MYPPSPTDYGLAPLPALAGGVVEVPPHFETLIGYDGRRRFFSVSLRDDGRPIVGDGEAERVGQYGPWSAWAHHPYVWPALVTAASQADPDPHVVVDRFTRRAYTSGAAAARRFLAEASGRRGGGRVVPRHVPHRELDDDGLSVDPDPLGRAEFERGALPRMTEWLGARPLPCPWCRTRTASRDYNVGLDGRPECPSCRRAFYAPRLFGRLTALRASTTMTHLFEVGDPVPSTYRAGTIELGQGRAYPGPGGLVVVVRLGRPTADQVELVERGAVALGVEYDRGRDAALILQGGEPGRPGAFDVVVEAGSRLDSLQKRWWGEDVLLVLCDEALQICAVTDFVGPGADLGDQAAVGSAEDPCVAVFPESRYGIVQPRGVLDADSWVDSARALVYDGAWEAGFSEVWDLREIDKAMFTPVDRRRLVDLEHEIAPLMEGSTSYAVLPPRRALSFAAHLYGRLVKPLGRKIVLCRSAEEAADLLGVDRIPVLRACEPEGGGVPAPHSASPGDDRSGLDP